MNPSMYSLGRTDQNLQWTKNEILKLCELNLIPFLLSNAVIYFLLQNIFSLVSSLGGALSLYLGISIFLLVEFVELLICLVYNSILFVMGRYKSPQDTPPPRQPTAKPSVSPSFPSKLPPDFCITTTTTVGDLHNLRNLYGE